MIRSIVLREQPVTCARYEVDTLTKVFAVTEVTICDDSFNSVTRSAFQLGAIYSTQSNSTFLLSLRISFHYIID